MTCCSCRGAVNSGQNYRFPILQQIHSERTLCSCLFVARKVKVKTFTLFSKMGSDSDCEAPKEETEEEVWVFLEIPFLPQKMWFLSYSEGKQTNPSRGRGEEGCPEETGQAGVLARLHCYGMVGTSVFLCISLLLGLGTCDICTNCWKWGVDLTVSKRGQGFSCKKKKNLLCFFGHSRHMHSQDLTLCEILDNTNGIRWSILEISVFNFVDNSWKIA